MAILPFLKRLNLYKVSSISKLSQNIAKIIASKKVKIKIGK
jgi:hypothetical protein